MERSLLQEMHQRIDAFIEQGAFHNKYIVIFGSNESAEKMMDYLNSKGVSVDAIVDNNPKKDGTVLYGIAVMLPEKCLLPKRDNCIILIASRYYPEMAMQLKGMGYEEGTEVLKAAEYSSQHANSLTEQEFEERVQIVKKGKQIYEKICADIPEIQKLFVFPPAELGATYVGMAYIGQYNKKNNICRFKILVRNGACTNVGYLFGYDGEIERVDKYDMEALLQYAVFSNMANEKILVVNHRHPYTCRLGEIGNYKEINFIDHFRYSIFKLGEKANPETPYIYRDNDSSKQYVDAFLKKEKLEKGKTVLLMPYANTAPKINMEFWEQLAVELKKKGYLVCTNSSGDMEPAIDGTQPVFFDLRYGLEIVEAAGVMIALRSGLCDMLSTATAKKIIIYPDRIYGPGTFMEFYSLNKLGLCGDVHEFLWEDNYSFLMKKIISIITGETKRD